MTILDHPRLLPSLLPNLHTISDDDVKTVERTAKAMGASLSDQQWGEVWRLLREGSSTPYTVLADMGFPDRVAV